MSPGGGRGFEIFCGVDVARETHYAVALDRDGRRLVERALPNDEPALRALFAELAEHGRLLMVVDQPASIGALAIAVARSMNIEVGYLPGLAMRRIADLYPGEGKTDARDAFVIADAARTLPHTLRRVGPDEETVTALGVLAGYDADLAAEATRLTNRLHDALLHVHPALERLLGKHFRRRGVLELLTAAGTPQQLCALDEDALRQALAPRSRRLALTLPAQIHTALEQQSVVIPATVQYGRVISGVAAQLLAVLDERVSVAHDLDTLLKEHPLVEVLISMPGVGARTAVALLLTLGDGSTFRTSGHLAAYAGLAPVTRQSGRTIRSERQPQRGNRALKQALYLSAFASLKHPDSRAYYDRKRAEGKNHTSALLCLARRRTDVLYAMVRDRTPYQPTVPSNDDGTTTTA
nr:IS110 family transposase [Micromonospora pisi]